MTIIISDDCPLLADGKLTGPALIKIFEQVPMLCHLHSIEKRGSITLLNFSPTGEGEVYQVEEVKELKLVKREAKR